MQTIIVQPGRHAHPNPDSAARQRRDRLAKASTDQMESALAFLSMIDPEAFEIAFTAVAVTPAVEQHDDAEAIPLCRHCGTPVAVFPDRGSHWQHFRGDATSGTRETDDPGHAAEIVWIIPDEDPNELE
jgi:hypothetical protein